jgi:transcription elongation factor GreB
MHEQSQLWHRRNEVVKALSEAAAEGDRSENAEYIYRKKELREIDARIRYLQKRIPALKVIENQPANKEVIYFGAWVTLSNVNNETFNYRLVGPDEFDQHKDYISIDSPVARALLKKTVGDELEIVTPKGVQFFDILQIRYHN